MAKPPHPIDGLLAVFALSLLLLFLQGHALPNHFA
jgi:hypothetical protein